MLLLRATRLVLLNGKNFRPISPLFLVEWILFRVWQIRVSYSIFILEYCIKTGAVEIELLPRAIRCVFLLIVYLWKIIKYSWRAQNQFWILIVYQWRLTREKYRNAIIPRFSRRLRRWQNCISCLCQEAEKPWIWFWMNSRAVWRRGRDFLSP
jgi:hypothetical protein